jgi:hypothetical protein
MDSAGVSLDANLTVEGYVLSTLLELEPDSAPEQYNVVVVIDDKGNYQVSLVIDSTAELDADDLVQSIVEASSDNGWTLQDDADPLSEDTESNDAADLFLAIVVGVLIVFCLVLVGVLLWLYNKKKRKTFTSDDGTAFTMPA